MRCMLCILQQEYRDSEIASFPAVAVDTRNAIRFMKLHGSEYMADTENLFVGGDSSGGHAAMFSQIIQDDAQETNLYPGINADVKGILSFYGANSMMLEDGMPSTLSHHLPNSPEGMQMGGVNLREHLELCRKMSVECNETTTGSHVSWHKGPHDQSNGKCCGIQSIKTMRKICEAVFSGRRRSRWK